LALFVIVALALLAMFLPIGNTYPLLQVFQAVLGFLSTILSAIVAVVALLMYFVISLLPQGEQPDRPSIEPGQLLQQSQPPAGTTVSAPSPFAGSLLWLAVVAMAIVAALYVMSDRGPNVSLDKLWELWHRFRRWLLSLGHVGLARVSALTGPVRWRLRRPPRGEQGRSPFRFLRIGALPPREQVRYLYLSLLRHADKQGMPRSQAATPLEFCMDLKTGWPEASPDLDQMTGAFLAARYGSGEIDKEQLRMAKQAWLRIRRRDRHGDVPAVTE